MAWERRIARQYFYKSVKVGGTCRKIYFGKGDAAAAEASRIAQTRQQRQSDREALAAEQARDDRVDRACAELRAVIDLLVSATLLLAGYHCHHGGWRRRRTRRLGVGSG